MSDALPFEIKLAWAREPQRPASAWLIQGADPAQWLAEIAAWGLREEELRLYLMPVSRAERDTAGLFVTTGAQQRPPARTPAALAFGVAARGFYAPVHARLAPAMEVAELEALKLYDIVVFHPAAGPVGFDDADAIPLAGLLAAPRKRTSEWTTPPVEVEPHSRIESISLRPMPMDLDALFGSESEDIGSDPVKMPEGQQPRGLFGKGLEYIKDMGLKAAGKWQPPSQRQQEERERALRQLIEQLEKNPEQGLKHALPINSAFLHRGLAPPGTQLGNRSTDFSIRRLGGGRAVDPWAMQEKIRQELRKNYLRLAEHERQLGRHRRAAYIHAELLGDLQAAARVLIEGKYWREAALLYRDHLHNPMEAARCFAEGRMIPDAVEIYRKQKEFEKLGLLYLKIGEEEKAGSVFREWVEQLKSAQKWIEASTVLINRLSARDEALGLLESAWPEHADSRRCIEKCLALRGQAGEHIAALELIRKLAASHLPKDTAIDLLRIFATQQTAYPDRIVREEAEDQGRRIIARALDRNKLSGQIPGATEKEMLRLLPYLAPDDRLLSRDVLRFSSRATASPMQPPASDSSKRTISSSGSHLVELKQRHEFRLPYLAKQQGRWIKADISSHGIWAVCAVPGQGLLAARANFDGHQQSCVWNGRLDVGNAQRNGVILSVPPGGAGNVFLSVTDASPLTTMKLSPDNGFSQSATIGALRGLSSGVIEAAYAHNEVLWIVRNTPTGALVTGLQPDGTIVTNFPAPSALDLPLLGEAGVGVSRMCFAFARRHVLFAVGNTLYRFGQPTDETSPLPEPVLVAEFGETILGLESGAPWASPCVKVQLQTQVALCWFDAGKAITHVLDHNLPGAVTTFTSDGYIVAITPEGGFIFSAAKQGQLRSARFSWKGEVPVDVGCGPTAGTFSIMLEDGIVQIFEFPQRGIK